MNAARLRELADLLTTVESQFNVQSILQQMLNELNQITSNPGQPQFQTQFSQSLGKFRTTWQQMIEAFSPAQAKLLNEIGAGSYFLDDIPAEIEEEAKDNNITPAVIRDKVQNIMSARDQYLTTIRDLRDRLKTIGIEAYQLEPGSAEIGLLLPRDLFHNELSGLVKELHTLNRIIRASVKPNRSRFIKSRRVIRSFSLVLILQRFRYWGVQLLGQSPLGKALKK